MRFLSIVFLYLGLTCVSACAAPTLTTIEVIDGYGNPVKGAKVVGRFNLGHRMSSGSTNRNGKTQLVGSLQSIARYEVTKTGYYDTNVTVGYTKSNTVTILLRKKRNPIAMYATKLTRKKALKIPVLNEKVGFDLFESDWVYPGYTGLKQDIFFKAGFDHSPNKIMYDNLPVKYFIETSFPNIGDGIQKAELDPNWRFSEFKLAYNAPGNNYKSKLESNYYSPNDRGGSEKNNFDDTFYMRIRSRTDDNGQIIQANYCKVLEGIAALEITENKNYTGDMVLSLVYYCNPSPNDTNIEFDPSKNLFEATSFSLDP